MAGTRAKKARKATWKRRALVGVPVVVAAAVAGATAYGSGPAKVHRVVAASGGSKVTSAGGTKAASPSASAAAAKAKAGAKVTSGGAASTLSASSTLAQRLSSTTLSLGSSFSYLQPGYNELASWTRVDTAVAPNGTLRVAWPAANGVHVTPVGAGLTRSGADTVVSGSQEVSGLVAQSDGFALLTRVADSNKWGETAAALIGYRNGARAFTTRLTGTSSNDTSPGLDGQLAWNGSEYGAYFVVHGAGGFADGHFGDKLAYVGASGARLSGGWDWGCSHNEGIALYPGASGAFTSACFDDWRSGLFVSTSIGAPDVAPVLQREQCWAGYCGGDFPQNSGDIVKSAATGRYAIAFASRGAASAAKNPADTSGRGWTVTPRWSTHQVAVRFLSDGSTPTGSTVYLTGDTSTDNVNVHLAPYGKNRLLLSWESVSNASCSAGTCTGHFTGTHLRLIDYTGRFLTADAVVPAHISGNIAVLGNGDLAWAYVNNTPSYASSLGASPTSTTLSLAHLRLIGG